MLQAWMSINSWKETAIFSSGPGARLSRVKAKLSYKGSMRGEAKAFLVLQYEDEKSGIWEGWQIFDGRFEDKKGRLMLRMSGNFSQESRSFRYAVIPGSGTAALEDFNFEGSVVMEGNGPYEIEITV